MLGVKTYPSDYIDACEAAIGRQLDLHQRIASKAAAAIELAEYEQRLLANLVLVLDHCFVHRLRTMEGKDGNPLNEVRMLSASILEHGGVLTADNTIKYKPANAVLGLAIGDPIQLDPESFRRLADAFFTELRAKFSATP